MTLNAATAQPEPSPSPVTPSSSAAPSSTPPWIMKSRIAAMNREPIPASVSSTSTPSGVEIRTLSSYSIAR